MKNKIARIILYSIFLLFECIGYAKDTEKMNNVLRLDIELNKSIVKISDTLNFKIIFTNISEEDIRILPWGSAYATNWIKIYDINNTEMDAIPTVIFELKIIPDQSDFILLKSNQSHIVNIAGKIKQGKVIGIDKKAHKGIFVNFSNSAIVFKDPGDYKVKARFKGEKLWEKQGRERYNFTNIWTSEIESNEVKIKILK